MKTVLFLCRENACRSQMAEGLARELFADRMRVLSAGSRPRGAVDPRAIESMREIGIDIAHQRSRSIDEVAHQRVDYVITVCGEEECPVFPGDAERYHWPIPDPAAPAGGPEQVMSVFRSVREDLAHRIRDFARGLAD